MREMGGERKEGRVSGRTVLGKWIYTYKGVPPIICLSPHIELA
jgi:hypothetical protein